MITLAGLLGFLGLQLLVLGKEGTINLPYDSALVGFATRSFLSPALGLRAGRGGRRGLRAEPAAWQRRAGTAAGLSAAPNSVIAIKAGALAVVLLIPVIVLNGDRGVSAMFLLFLGAGGGHGPRGTADALGPLGRSRSAATSRPPGGPVSTSG